MSERELSELQVEVLSNIANYGIKNGVRVRAWWPWAHTAKSLERRGLIEIDVTETAWITPAGRRWLAEHERAKGATDG